MPNDEEDIAFTEESDFILHSMRDGVDTFDEISCAYGALGRFPFWETMSIIKGMKSKIDEITDHFYQQYFIQINQFRKLTELVSEDRQNADFQQSDGNDYSENLIKSFGTPLRGNSMKNLSKEDEEVRILTTKEHDDIDRVEYESKNDQERNGYFDFPADKFGNKIC